MMENKSGFEIRADILAIAKDYVENQTRLNIDYATKMYELGKMHSEQYLEMIKPHSMADIMYRAKEMYSFVSKK